MRQHDGQHRALRCGRARPVIGPRGTKQLDGYLDAVDVTLRASRYDRLAEVSMVPLGAPHQIALANRNSALGGAAFRVPTVPGTDRTPVA